MKNINVYEVGDKVRIEVEVMGIKIKDGKPEYWLRNPQTGDKFDYRFSEEQIFPTDDEKDN